MAETPSPCRLDDVGGVAAGITAATAELVDMLAEIDRSAAWEGPGLRSLGHWASIELGLATHVANEMAAVGRCLRGLPDIAAAFASGALSWDKVRLIARVAVPATEDRFLTLARAASVGQLVRICREYRRDIDRRPKPGSESAKPDPESAEAAKDRESRREVWIDSMVDEHGLVRLMARLLPEEAALVKAAIDQHAEIAWRDAHPDTDSTQPDPDQPDPDQPDPAQPDAAEETHAPGGDGTDPTPDTDTDVEVGTRVEADDQPDAEAEARAEKRRTYAARRADAFVSLAETALAAGPTPLVGGDRCQVILHIDHTALADRFAPGRCAIEEMSTVGAATARRLACDATITALIEDALGRPLGVGRTTRTVPRWLRRALKQRDHGCAFPGCGATRYLEAHHIIHWIDRGPTDLWNLVLLCGHHHRLHHHDAYLIRTATDGTIHFTDPEGRSLGPPIHPPEPIPVPHRRARPLALGGGDPNWDLALTLDSLTGA